jgi:hypothetical protein
MTAASIRSQLLGAVADAKVAVEKNPRPETYRALLEAQSELQRHDLQYSRKNLRGDLARRSSVYGSVDRPSNMRTNGHAPTLEAAKGELATCWHKWLAWAELSEGT